MRVRSIDRSKVRIKRKSRRLNTVQVRKSRRRKKSKKRLEDQCTRRSSRRFSFKTLEYDGQRFVKQEILGDGLCGYYAIVLWIMQTSLDNLNSVALSIRTKVLDSWRLGLEEQAVNGDESAGKLFSLSLEYPMWYSGFAGSVTEMERNFRTPSTPIMTGVLELRKVARDRFESVFFSPYKLAKEQFIESLTDAMYASQPTGTLQTLLDDLISAAKKEGHEISETDLRWQLSADYDTPMEQFKNMQDVDATQALSDGYPVESRDSIMREGGNAYMSSLYAQLLADTLAVKIDIYRAEPKRSGPGHVVVSHEIFKPTYDHSITNDGRAVINLMHSGAHFSLLWLSDSMTELVSLQTGSDQEQMPTTAEVAEASSSTQKSYLCPICENYAVNEPSEICQLCIGTLGLYGASVSDTILSNVIRLFDIEKVDEVEAMLKSAILADDKVTRRLEALLNDGSEVHEYWGVVYKKMLEHMASTFKDSEASRWSDQWNSLASRALNSTREEALVSHW